MRRRRFLALSAAALGLPGALSAGTETRWSGYALGAEVTMTLRAPKALAEVAIDAARREIDAVEEAFSLFRHDSQLVRLNTTGHLALSPLLTDLMNHIDRAHALTDGTFDPTVQAVWADLAQGRNPAPARTTLGWHRVMRTDGKVQLQPGQSLTFNGIAQGFATDRVRATLKDRGFGNILINIGEYAGLGGPWHLGIADPIHGLVARTVLTDGAIATTSAAPHVISPQSDAPRHATVSVEAPTATLADALSTAFLFLDSDHISQIRDRAGAGPVHLIAPDGAHRRI